MAKVIKISEEDEETKVADIDGEPITTELAGYITTELDVYKIKQKFVKRIYYTLIGVLYFTFCALFNYYVMYVDYYGRQISFDVSSLLWFFLDTLLVALIFPFVILVLSFASGGILFGVLVGLTYGLFGLLSRGIMKILGFDLELIFPELVGHTGVVSKPNVLGKFTSYNLFEKKIGNLYKIEHHKNYECLIFLNSGGVCSTTFYIPLNNFFLNILNKIDNVLTKVFPKIFATGRQIVLRKI